MTHETRQTINEFAVTIYRGVIVITFAVIAWFLRDSYNRMQTTQDKILHEMQSVSNKIIEHEYRLTQLEK